MEKKTAADSPAFDLPVIARLLKETREGKGLGVDEVSKALFLRKSLIQALESGSWEKLPHPVYVKGYASQYAAYLKIQAEILPLFKAGGGKTADSVETVPTVPIRELDEKERPKGKRRLPLGRTAAYAMVAVFLVAFFVVRNIERPVAVSPGYGNVAKSFYEAKGSQTGQGTVVLEARKLMIACKERTWVRIVIDGTEKKEFMLNPQEMVVFTGKEAFDLLIGNAGGVNLYYNGSDTGFSGESGQVKRVRLP